MKRTLILLITVVLIASVLSACSCAVNDDNVNTKSESDSSSVATEETLKLIKTTPDGVIVEQDSEGNTITKQRDGNIISVKDKNGKPLDINEYLSSHPAAWNIPSDTDSSDSDSATEPETKKNSKSDKKSNTSNNSDSDEGVEKELPTEIGDASNNDETVMFTDF